MIVQETVKLICIIVNRGLGERIFKDIGKHLNFTHMTIGRGTANSEVMAVLGLGEDAKDVLIGGIDGNKVDDVFKVLNDKYRFGLAGNGIAFTLPVTSTGGKVALQILSGKTVK